MWKVPLLGMVACGAPEPSHTPALQQRAPPAAGLPHCVGADGQTGPCGEVGARAPAEVPGSGDGDRGAGRPAGPERLDVSTEEAVRRAIGEQRPAVEACYDDWLATHPESSGGRVVMEVAVRGGAVVDVSVESDTIGAPQLTGCVSQALRKVVPPAELDDTLLLPFAFQPR